MVFVGLGADDESIDVASDFEVVLAPATCQENGRKRAGERAHQTQLLSAIGGEGEFEPVVQVIEVDDLGTIEHVAAQLPNAGTAEPDDVVGLGSHCGFDPPQQVLAASITRVREGPEHAEKSQRPGKVAGSDPYARDVVIDDEVAAFDTAVDEADGQ